MHTHKDKFIELVASGKDPKLLEDELLAMMDEEWLQIDNAVLDEYLYNVEEGGYV